MSTYRLLLISILFILLAADVSAQFDAHAVVSQGAYLQSGHETAAAGWAGFESTLLKVSDQGFAAVTRVGLYYVNSEEDVQGLSAFLLGKKSFRCDYLPSFYALAGGGFIYEILEGYDSQDAALKIEIGLDIYRRLGIGIGVDYIPDPATDDKWFLYGAINLTPPVCR